MDPIQRDEGMKAMRVGQLLAGVGIGLTAGSIDGWKMVQQRQTIAVSPNAAPTTSAALLISDSVSNSAPNPVSANQPDSIEVGTEPQSAESSEAVY